MACPFWVSQFMKNSTIMFRNINFWFGPRKSPKESKKMRFDDIHFQDKQIRQTRINKKRCKELPRKI